VAYSLIDHPLVSECCICGMRIAEFRKGVFCGIKIAENVLVVELCQLIRCTSIGTIREH